MIIKAITIENFKAIRDPVRIEFAPITLLFGANSSGKSTVIKALQFARAVFKMPGADPFDVTATNNLDLGDFRESVNGQDLSKTIGLTFEIELNSPIRVSYELNDLYDRLAAEPELADNMPTEGFARNISTATITVRIRYDDLIGAAYVCTYGVTLNHVPFGVIEYSASEGDARIQLLNYCHPLLIEIDPQYAQMGYKDQSSAYDAWLKDAGISSEEDRAELAGDGSNTALEYFVARHNQAPFEGKSFPIKINNQKGAVHGPFRTLSLALGKDIPRRMSHSDPDEMQFQLTSAILSEGLLSPAAALCDFLDGALFLGPLRSIPARHARSQHATGKPSWSSGEASWDKIVSAGPDFVSEVNAWLSRPDRLNSGYGVGVIRYRELGLDDPLMSALLEKEDVKLAAREVMLKHIPIRSRVVLIDRVLGLELAAQDVGVGLSQLLPVVVAALQRSRSSLLVNDEQLVTVEQPELHLHPALQSRVADLFIATAKDRQKVFLLETHSEHLMLRCLRRIRETAKGILPEGFPPVVPEDVAVHFVEPSKDGPRIRRIEIDEEGDFIDEWPGGFFEESFHEKFAGR